METLGTPETMVMSYQATSPHVSKYSTLIIQVWSIFLQESFNNLTLSRGLLKEKSPIGYNQ